MNREIVFREMVEIVREFVSDPELLQGITPQTDIIHDLRVNSARLVDFIIRAEEVFDIEIGDDDADRIQTLGDAADVVLGLRQTAQCA